MRLQLMSILSVLLMIAMNFLANALPINGKTTGELSKQWNNEFVPSGFTFSIWGVIYLLIILFTVKGLISEKGKFQQKKIGWLFPVSCVLNGLWILAWHYEQLPLSIGIIVLMLLTILFINIRIKKETTLVKSTFGLYLGWLCIATIANISAWLTHIKWDGMGVQPWIWAIVMLIAGSCIAIFASYRLKNLWISIAVMWALIGIAARHSAENKNILIASLVAISILPLSITLGCTRQKKNKQFANS